MENNQLSIAELEQKLKVDIYQQQLQNQWEALKYERTIGSQLISSCQQQASGFSAYRGSWSVPANPTIEYREYYCEYCLNEKSSGCGCGAKKWKIK
jgi:hypothetical protein